MLEKVLTRHSLVPVPCEGACRCTHEPSRRRHAGFALEVSAASNTSKSSCSGAKCAAGYSRPRPWSSVAADPCAPVSARPDLHLMDYSIAAITIATRIFVGDTERLKPVMQLAS